MAVALLAGSGALSAGGPPWGTTRPHRLRRHATFAGLRSTCHGIRSSTGAPLCEDTTAYENGNVPW
jgi:hypothetical protein